MFSIIAAIGKHGELGKDGQLIFHIKEDMQFFRDTTKGHKIVMGRKTWDSLPKKLPGRENIVVSSRDFDGPDRIIHDIDQFISKYQSTSEEIFVIGGGAIYAKFLPYAEYLYLTEIDATVEDADTFFPTFDPTHYTRELIKKGKDHDLTYSIVRYAQNQN